MKKRLKQARIEAGLSQREVATAVGVKANTIWRYEAGIFEPSEPVMTLLARLYGRQLEWFYEEENTARNVLVREEPGDYIKNFGNPHSPRSRQRVAMDLTTEERDLILGYRHLTAQFRRLVRSTIDELRAPSDP